MFYSILQKKEGDEYLLNKILDKAGNKGTGSWSTKAALELGSVNTMMSGAVFARYISSFKQQRIKLSGKISRSNKPETPIDRAEFLEAYQAARLLNHIQGFELMKTAGIEYNWDLNFSEIARIWTNGCIIRSSLMEQLVDLFKKSDSLLEQKSIIDQLHHSESSLASLLSKGLNQQIPLPVFSSAWHYWLPITTEQSPANLIQAQRDFFGAHTYQRNDDDSGTFYHTEW